MISSANITSLRGRPAAKSGPGRQRPQAGQLQGVAVGQRIQMTRGQALYLAGQVPAAPYLVVSGVLRLMVQTATHKERLADLAGPGDVVATSVFDGSPSAETVVAASAAEVVQIDVASTLASVNGRQQLASALVQQLKRSRELADDLGLPMGARICRILSRMAIRLGERPDGARAAGAASAAEWRHLPFNLTHDDVALLAGCARVTATRVLGELKEAGVLKGHRGNYTLVPGALEQAADQYVYEVL